ncbi:MAG TPA: FAD-dependent oxidoreductase [Patescibacteria group bacterium]|nr:FAD-dependent oxidoreductase [Patescibacteria group bacterium]
MRNYKYFIIGGGMTADAAASGIRELDSKGSIGLITAELDPPYDRPPLTKGLWKDKSLDTVWRNTEKRNVEVCLARTAKTIDVQHKTVTDDSKEVYSFEKLLLATGGSPRRLPFGGDDIIYFRTLRDYRRLRDLADNRKRFGVIGGGFIGSELAASLASNDKKVTMIFPGTGIGDRMFPPDLSQFLNDFYRQKGVDVWTGDSVVGLERRGEELVLKTRSQREVTVDGVVAGLGIEPNLELAKQIGLQTGDGILVDEYLRTSQPDIYAAGDAAFFYNPALDRRLRVEHEDNANTMGRLAGRNMAGAAEAYTHLPFFYSDLFELGYEAVGELDARLSVLADWKDPHREGVVYYQKEGIVRGVLLWNVWGQVDAAREVIASKRPFRPEELKHKLPKAAETR